MVQLYAAVTSKYPDREAARRLLAHSARRAWGWEALPEIAAEEGGKPFFPSAPGRWYNLSHSRGLILCALSDQGEVGVDIERLRPHRPGLPAYVMSEDELAAFDGSWEDFARVWTLKEAYAKFLGRPVFPPRELPVPPPVPHRSYAGDGWRAALCGAGELPEAPVWVPEGELENFFENL